MYLLVFVSLCCVFSSLVFGVFSKIRPRALVLAPLDAAITISAFISVILCTILSMFDSLL